MTEESINNTSSPLYPRSALKKTTSQGGIKTQMSNQYEKKVSFFNKKKKQNIKEE